MVIFWGIFTITIYMNLKDYTIKQTYEKTDILFSHIRATINYAQKHIRPQLRKILPENAFIKEAMSISVINKGIMSEFKRFFPEFEYRRVAENPFNIENSPNQRELRYLKIFRASRAKKIEETIYSSFQSLLLD